MNKEDYFEFGFITKTHGLDGELLLFMDVDEPSYYEDIETIFIQNKQDLVPYFLEYVSKHNDRYIIKIEEVETIEVAETFKGAKVFLPASALPKLNDGQFYYHDIIDFQVKDQHCGDLGIVKKVYTNASQDLIAMSYKGKEVLIPVTDDIVLKADLENKILETALPEGLIDIYLED